MRGRRKTKPLVMKNFIYFFANSLMVCAALLVLGCKKQFVDNQELPTSASLQVNNANQCRPAILGAYDLSYKEWRTLAQKWYSNGRVKYLKAKFGGPADVGMNSWLEGFDLKWGEVSYEGNQVYLKDVLNANFSMRVTLDNDGRPVASYYYYKFEPNYHLYDTTYYYYKNDRLDYMISLFELSFYSPTPIFLYRKYVFSYDSYGNLVRAEFPDNARLNVQYDYTKPGTSIHSNLQVTSSLKLLEYMELIQLPSHHAATRTNFEVVNYPGTPYEYFSEVFYAEYRDYVIEGGLVQSFVYYQPYRQIVLYNGWDCGTTSSINTNNSPENAVSNLQQFQKMYPEVTWR